jgi:hypothetical protein
MIPTEIPASGINISINLSLNLICNVNLSLLL